MTDNIEKLAKKRERLIGRMQKFAREVKAEDCAGLAGQGPRTEYKHQHKSMKRKGGKPPADYTAVEMLIDLQIELKRNNFDDAIPLYYALKRMLNYD